MYLNLVSIMFLFVPVLLNIAFLTLMERKILGLSQSRKGPNKVALGGIFQPFADAIKLFSKESISPLSSNSKIFLMGPSGALLLTLLGWSVLPWEIGSFDFSLIILLLVLGLGLYPLLLSGWASNSAYALIGALRGVAQTISYEVSLAVLMMCFFALVSGLSLKSLSELAFFTTLPLAFILVLMWLITGLAETNRTPFDFAEGESELVSGFNIEYGSGGFALIFMAEYGSIFLLSFLTAVLAGAGQAFSSTGILAGSLVAFFWIWARATLPRYRYDKLMSLAWKGLLPVTLSMLMCFMML